jgi:hypothetical protein
MNSLTAGRWLICASCCAGEGSDFPPALARRQGNAIDMDMGIPVARINTFI